MTMRLLLISVLGAMLVHSAAASVEQHQVTIDGLSVDYRVLLPNDYDSSQRYPVVQHFAGGPQTMRIVERSTESDWREHAEQRGIIVVSPATPNGELFFQGADRIFPALSSIFSQLIRCWTESCM